MLRLRRKMHVRIPDRLAAVCAVLLLVTALSGKDDSGLFRENSAAMAAADWEGVIGQAEEEVSAGRANSNRGLDISLLIFRHH